MTHDEDRLHGYFDIDEDAVWAVVEQHLDDLKVAVEEELERPE